MLEQKQRNLRHEWMIILSITSTLDRCLIRKQEPPIPTGVSFQAKLLIKLFVKFCGDVAKMPRKDDKSIVCRLFLFLAVGTMAHHIFGVDWWDVEKDGLKNSICRKRGQETYNLIRINLKLASWLASINQAADDCSAYRYRRRAHI